MILIADGGSSKINWRLIKQHGENSIAGVLMRTLVNRGLAIRLNN
jgi:hypothetical protein